jgi:hypothetical protein
MSAEVLFVFFGDGERPCGQLSVGGIFDAGNVGPRAWATFAAQARMSAEAVVAAALETVDRIDVEAACSGAEPRHPRNCRRRRRRHQTQRRRLVALRDARRPARARRLAG